MTDGTVNQTPRHLCDITVTWHNGDITADGT